MTGILSRLEKERIFSIEKTAEGFSLTEASDGYFSVSLSNDELLQLADELRLLARGEGDYATLESEFMERQRFRAIAHHFLKRW
jgi:hypothetical protein